MTTPQLLPLTILSRRIYSLILRILHNRIVAASTLDSHSVLLECFHPSAKLTEPPYFCTYLGTGNLGQHENFFEDDTEHIKRLGQMRNVYSRFRPYRRELERGGRRVARSPGDIPGSRTFPGTAQDQYRGETVKQVLSLDSHELFAQLVSQSNIVKIGPRNGLFSSFSEVEEGVVRVWRTWLRDMAARNDVVGKGKDPVTDGDVDVEDGGILWVSPKKHTGIRLNIKERKLRRDAPILMRADEEDVPVSYEIEYDGKLYLPSLPAVR